MKLRHERDGGGSRKSVTASRVTLFSVAVVSTMDEPLKGWIDNFNGPIGMLVGGGKGILRVCFADPDVNSDYVPVDVIVKTMITSARQRGLKTYGIYSYDKREANEFRSTRFMVSSK